ncbi:hypothetical protein AC1031_011142 [Aphanomyces cochlioides]|nr:hypothetical protein AC1031_011142 [Aphanomyces cochlioides]
MGDQFTHLTGDTVDVDYDLVADASLDSRLKIDRLEGGRTKLVALCRADSPLASDPHRVNHKSLHNGGASTKCEISWPQELLKLAFHGHSSVTSKRSSLSTPTHQARTMGRFLFFWVERISCEPCRCIFGSAVHLTLISFVFFAVST